MPCVGQQPDTVVGGNRDDHGMERIADPTGVLRQGIEDYVRDQDDSNAYWLEDIAHHLLAVLVVPKDKPQQSLTILVARIEDDMVIIETDLTDKPLFQALEQAGVPREQIVLAYAGETVEETA